VAVFFPLKGIATIVFSCVVLLLLFLLFSIVWYCCYCLTDVWYCCYCFQLKVLLLWFSVEGIVAIVFSCVVLFLFSAGRYCNSKRR